MSFGGEGVEGRKFPRSINQQMLKEKEPCACRDPPPRNEGNRQECGSPSLARSPFPNSLGSPRNSHGHVQQNNFPLSRMGPVSAKKPPALQDAASLFLLSELGEKRVWTPYSAPCSGAGGDSRAGLEERAAASAATTPGQRGRVMLPHDSDGWGQLCRPHRMV